MENGPKLTLRTAPEPGKMGKLGFKCVALMSKRLILFVFQFRTASEFSIENHRQETFRHHLFYLRLGFDKGASQEPITIVEFKRPKRDDYTMSSNPFVQVQDYVEMLREAGEATSNKGQRIGVIESETPFLCQTVADDTKPLKDMMNRIGGFYRKAGSKSYYRWDDVFNTFMEVTSYANLSSCAKARHEAFFERLGISF